MIRCRQVSAKLFRLLEQFYSKLLLKEFNRLAPFLKTDRFCGILWYMGIPMGSDGSGPYPRKKILKNNFSLKQFSVALIWYVANDSRFTRINNNYKTTRTKSEEKN